MTKVDGVGDGRADVSVSEQDVVGCGGIVCEVYEYGSEA